MGLDTVELVVTVEKYFGITIPNAEAEKIATIRDMTNTVARHLAITNEGRDLRDEVFKKLTDAMHALGWTVKKIELSYPLSFCISGNTGEVWGSLRKAIGLSIPTPMVTNPVKTGILNRLINPIQ